MGRAGRDRFEPVQVDETAAPFPPPYRPREHRLGRSPSVSATATLPVGELREADVVAICFQRLLAPRRRATHALARLDERTAGRPFRVSTSTLRA
jgi:hypothetical protein